MNEDALIIVPAFNEASMIEETLAELKNFANKIVVVDDGSQDDTSNRAKKAGVILLRHSANLGYGAALKTGFSYALRYEKEPFLVTFDADGQHDARFISSLLEPLRKNQADYVIGSRFLGKSLSSVPLPRKIGSRIFGFCTTALVRQKITDPTSGMLGLTRKVAKIFLSNLFPLDFPDADVLIMLNRMGFRLMEVPVVMRPARRAGGMHSGVLKPAYYLAKMSLSMLHFALRRDLKEKRKELENVS